MTNTRITPKQIKELVDSCTHQFHHFPGTTTTACAFFLPSGFSLAIGYSACVDPQNFDEKYGQEEAWRDAFQKAVDKAWELEGYALSKELANANTDT